MNRTIEDIQKDIELLGIKGGYDIEQLLTPQDCRRLSYEIERLQEELDKTRLSELDKEYRIDKAIEYMDNLKVEDFSTRSQYGYILVDYNRLVSILMGKPRFTNEKGK